MHSNSSLRDLFCYKYRSESPKFVETLVVYKNLNTSGNNRFNAGWFIPYLRDHKGTLTLVFISSFVIQLLGLATPLVIQDLIDKAISQRSLDTLQVLGASLLVVAVIEGILGMLRIFLFTEVTNRIDMSFSSTVILKLFRLPLSYFDKRNAGELSTRFQETEKK